MKQERGAFAAEGLDDVAWGLASGSQQVPFMVAYSKMKMKCEAKNMAIVYGAV